MCVRVRMRVRMRVRVRMGASHLDGSEGKSHNLVKRLKIVEPLAAERSRWTPAKQLCLLIVPGIKLSFHAQNI